MTWWALSPAGQTRVQELRAASSAWMGRTRRMTAALETLAALGEPAAIVPLAAVLLDTDVVVAHAAAAALERLWSRLPAVFLPTLDWAMRREWWSGLGPAWPPIVPGDLDRLPRGALFPALPLGLHSMHPSGHVRQAALVRLDGWFAGDDAAGGGGTLPFVLLRLDDWVPAVRGQAEAAVRRRLNGVDRGAYLRHLDLLGRLRQRLRAAGSDALARVETLLGGDLPTLLAASLLVGVTSSTRRYGLELVWRTASAPGQPPSVAQMVLEGMLASGTDPAVRVFAARRVLAALSNGEEDDASSRWASLLPCLLADRSAAVRRLALAWAAEREGARHLLALRAALLDPSPPARALAQFHLPRLDPTTDLRQFYRDQVERRARDAGNNGSHGRPLRAALAGLGECGRAEDAVLALPFAGGDAPVGVRRVALAALARLNPVGHLELFWMALEEAAPGVSRQAGRALTPLAPQVGAARLTVLLRQSPHAHVRLQALMVARRLPRWAALPVFIEAAGEPRPGDEPLTTVAANLLRAWLAGYNGVFYALRPTQAEIGRVKEALNRRGEGLESALRHELLGLLESLRA